jgi:hypothetical protein
MFYQAAMDAWKFNESYAQLRRENVKQASSTLASGLEAMADMAHHYFPTAPLMATYLEICAAGVRMSGSATVTVSKHITAEWRRNLSLLR